MKRHLTDEEIHRYIDSEYILKEPEYDFSKPDERNEISLMRIDEILKIEEHLDECELCLEKVTKALDFSLSFQQWLNESPSVEQKMLLKVLKAINIEETDVKTRITKWLTDWQSFMNNAVDVFLDTTYNGISNITKLLKERVKESNKGMHFRYPVESFVMRGDPHLCFEKKVENTLYGSIGQEDILKITAQSEKRRITIKSKKSEKRSSSPIFILIPVEGGVPIIKLSQELKEDEGYEISIEGLKPGQYLLAIEPEEIE